ncbi:uncharacterized protein LOC117171114 [Belonocnema kinseyi]|uniref:uncharacterized protein LOC117171114 n=1 Tax=Belonocnema kinseyi TaxID=2817044 RepID=UPI00143D7602|nr:uncharacterized protein LOC117171114 [Belonocnema kinseyi]
MCRRGTAGDDIKTSVVHKVVNDMKFYKKPIKTADLRGVAVQLMNKFSQTFEDKNDDGSRLDNGYNGIQRKLQERYNYATRTSKRGAKFSDSLGLKLKHRRTLEAIQMGTINWQPEAIPDDETEESVKEMITTLRNLNDFQEVNPGSDYEHLLKVTYAKQRLFLNDIVWSPKVDDILKTWPVLFFPATIFWHFEMLTGLSLDKFNANFKDKVKTILLYGKYKLDIPIDNLNEEEKLEKVIDVVQLQFQESECTFLRYCPVSIYSDKIL